MRKRNRATGIPDAFNDYANPLSRQIRGDSVGESFRDQLNKRFAAVGIDLGFPVRFPAMFPGQANMIGQDGGRLWNGMSLPGAKLAFAVNMYWDVNKIGEVKSSKSWLLDQSTGVVNPVTTPLPYVSYQKYYNEFRILADTYHDTTGTALIDPSTTIKTYYDVQECSYTKYSKTGSIPIPTGLYNFALGAVGIVLGSYTLPFADGYQPVSVYSIQADTKYTYQNLVGDTATESTFVVRLDQYEAYVGASGYGDIYGWYYSIHSFTDAEDWCKLGKIRKGDNYVDVPYGFFFSRSEESILYRQWNIPVNPECVRDSLDAVTEYFAIDTRNLVHDGEVIKIPLGSYTLHNNSYSGVAIYPLSLNIFDTAYNGGSPTITFCYQEWTEQQETDAVVYVVTSYPFKEVYIYRKMNGTPNSSERKWVEYTNSRGVVERYYMGDDSELVLIE